MKNNFLGWIKRNDVWVFFVLVFALTWPRGIAGTPYSQGSISEPPSTILNVLYFIGTPLVAAILVVALTRGRQGLKEWVGRLFRWRVGRLCNFVIGNRRPVDGGNDVECRF